MSSKQTYQKKKKKFMILDQLKKKASCDEASVCVYIYHKVIF